METAGNSVIRVLMIEDNPGDARLVRELLAEKGGFRLETAEDLARGLDCFADKGADILLLDLNLPDSRDLDTLKTARLRIPEIPIVVMTDLADELLARKALMEGAQDYLVKGSMDGILLVRSIRYAIERRNIMEELRQSERRLRLLTDNMGDTIFAYDMNRRLIYANPAFEKLTGYSLQELWDRNYINYLHPEDEPRLLELWEGLFRGESFDNVEFRIVTKGGEEKWCSGSWGPLFDETGWQIGVRGREIDITAAKRAEEERRKLEEYLAQSNKLESIGNLAGGIAHDINNILGIILLNTAYLELEGASAKERLKNLQNIKESLQRGTDLVRRILTFARKVETVFTSIDLNNLVEEIHRIMTVTFSKTIVYCLRTASDLPRILGDSTQLHQVLLNLCLNARDAMAEGGTLEIRTEAVPGTEVRKIFPAAPAEKYVALNVSDTGCGMDEATQKKLFDPFFTTKGEGKGTGMGLAVVYGIVNTHGGFIAVESRPGKGTTFRVFLPVGLHTATAALTREIIREDVPGGHETILLVEDEEMLVALAREILETKGYRVLVSTDGLEAVDLFARGKDGIDVVFADLGLPGIRGDEVLGRVLGIQPGMKVAMMSGYLEPEVMVRMEKAGVRHFLSKPYMPHDLLRKVREALDG